MIPFKSNEVKNYVNSLPDLQKSLVLVFRDAVLSTDTRINESIKWNSIVFFNKKNICGFRVGKSHVTLLFMKGATLRDNHEILEGKGKEARTYKLFDPMDINVTAITELVKESIENGM